MTQTLGTRIKQVRLAYGMSQAELAKRIAVSKQTMNMIEAGTIRDPAASRIKAIAQVLYVSSDYLLGLTDTR